MSSYLNFYLVPKEQPDKKLAFLSYSRSHEVYQRFSDNLNIAWAGDDELYTEITSADIDVILKDIDEDLSKANARRENYEKFCYGNPETIEEIVSIKEYIQELQHGKEYISFIGDIISDMSFKECAFCKLLCNIG